MTSKTFIVSRLFELRCAVADMHHTRTNANVTATARHEFSMRRPSLCGFTFRPDNDGNSGQSREPLKSGQKLPLTHSIHLRETWDTAREGVGMYRQDGQTLIPCPLRSTRPESRINRECISALGNYLT